MDFGYLLTLWHQIRFYVLCGLIVLCLGFRYYTKNNQPAIGANQETKVLLATEKSKHSQITLNSEEGKVQIQEYEIDIRKQEADIAQNSRLQRQPLKRVQGIKAPRKTASTTQGSPTAILPVIFFFSLTQSTRAQAIKFEHGLKTTADENSGILQPILLDLCEIDFEDYFEQAIKGRENQQSRPLYLILVPSYNIDTVLDTFIEFLKETHNDFRVGTSPLASIAGYSVFGFGDREGWPTEAEGFCSQATQTDKWMAKLTGRKRAFPLGQGDVKSDVDVRFAEWMRGINKTTLEIQQTGVLGEGVEGSGNAMESDEEEELAIALTDSIGETSQIRNSTDTSTVLGDLEDLGGSRRATKRKSSDRTKATSGVSAATQAPKLMVPKESPTYAALTKQGYTIVGSHSGVKICRWTKSALRGRGSCYKYTFYGIQSHLCMETTPALSCSNKCVFCWRHGTNPVGTTWRWQVDPPDMIFNGAKEGHYKKIKMMRGVPGVRAERYQEAMRIQHCALSLVGEPIFYPHINAFLQLLHAERISSFLVCNAQHPDELAALGPVTQLYVSIDASNAESLRRIDRPLHRDYWQRFQRCLDILRDKRFLMRTVFRLTLVKGFNVEEEVEGYADLVARGLPCFIEIKGVTYCGTSTSASAGLTMQNVPFYDEIVVFVEALNSALERRGLDYGIAAEHAHSCCVLIASGRFRVDGYWHTRIDYEKFFACLETGKEFRPEDYMGAQTPEWATWGRGGFDPRDERVDRKGRVIAKVATNSKTVGLRHAIPAAVEF